MATEYTETDNLGLSLYGDNDPADLRDGYNASMNKLDEHYGDQLNRIEGLESRETHDEEVIKAALGDNTVDAATTAKTKWDKAASIATDDNKSKWDNAATDSTRNTQNLEALNATTTERAEKIYNAVISNDRWNNVTTPIAVFFGDSITEGAGASNNNNRFSTKLCRIINATEKNYAIGGTIWKSIDETQIGNATNDITNKNAVKYVFCFTGANASNTTDEISNATSAVKKIHTNFPNAIIYVGGLFAQNKWAENPNTTYPPAIEGLGYMHKFMTALMQLELPIVYVEAWKWLINSFSWVTDDHLHPNDAGHAIIASNFASIVLGGCTATDTITNHFNHGWEAISIDTDKSTAKIDPNKGQINAWVSLTASGVIFFAKGSNINITTGGTLNFKVPAQYCTLISTGNTGIIQLMPPWNKTWGSLSEKSTSAFYATVFAENGKTNPSNVFTMSLQQYDGFECGVFFFIPFAY